MRHARSPWWSVLPLLLAALPAKAGYPSVQLDIASDRLFRGLSQNNGLSASARADYAFDSRAYLGTLVANNRSAGDAEVDAYAGYSRSLVLRDLIPYRLDAGVAGYFYTGDHSGPRLQNLDYAEVYAGVAVGPVSFKAYFSPDYYNLGAAAYRFNGTLKWPLTNRLTVAATLAWNDGEGVRRLIAGRTDDGHGHPYLDYSLSLQHSLPQGFALYLQAAGTNLEIDDRRLPRVLLGLSKRFDF